MPVARGLWPFLLLALFAQTALAEDSLGQFGAWKALHVIEKGQTLCYMVAHPPAEKTKPLKKGAKPVPGREAYAMVTFRPADSLSPVFSYGAGAVLKEASEAVLVTMRDKFSLFTSGQGAWARTASVDKAIVKMMQKGGAMAVVAFTPAGKKLADKFDLKGAATAYKKIAAACGIP